MASLARLTTSLNGLNMILKGKTKRGQADVADVADVAVVAVVPDVPDVPDGTARAFEFKLKRASFTTPFLIQLFYDCPY